MRPIRLPAPSVNQTDPSGAIATVVGPLFGCGNSHSVGWPSVVNCAAAATDASRRLRKADRLGDNLWIQLTGGVYDPYRGCQPNNNRGVYHSRLPGGGRT